MPLVRHLPTFQLGRKPGAAGGSGHDPRPNTLTSQTKAAATRLILQGLLVASKEQLQLISSLLLWILPGWWSGLEVEPGAYCSNFKCDDCGIETLYVPFEICM